MIIHAIVVLYVQEVHIPAEIRKHIHVQVVHVAPEQAVHAILVLLIQGAIVREAPEQMLLVEAIAVILAEALPLHREAILRIEQQLVLPIPALIQEVAVEAVILLVVVVVAILVVLVAVVALLVVAVVVHLAVLVVAIEDSL